MTDQRAAWPDKQIAEWVLGTLFMMAPNIDVWRAYQITGLFMEALEHEPE